MQAVVPVGTSAVSVLSVLGSTRQIVLTNQSGSAGNATFTHAGSNGGSALFSSTTLAPGASSTIAVPSSYAVRGGSIKVSAASKAVVRIQRTPH